MTEPAESHIDLEVALLGRPCARRGPAVVDGVRGTKVWAVLAVLALGERPVDRGRLAQLLFPDAADPAGALRWALSQLRGRLGLTVGGDPVVLEQPASVRIDVRVLTRGSAADAVAMASLGGELLAGVDASGNPSFEAWLDTERRHVRAMTADVLREEGVSLLARGEPSSAVSLAERAVALEPLDENAAVLLVRSLREAGRPHEAREVAAAAATRLRSELGVEPSPSLRAAAHGSVGGTARAGGRVSVEAQLEAGEAALAAGVTDVGIDALREAVAGGRAIAHPDLLARSLIALGGALIHAVRGVDQDALALLHEAIPAALDAGLMSLAARAERELGYVDLLRGGYERATWWLDRAADHASGDDAELAWILAVAGAARTDVADHDRAGQALGAAIDHALAAGDRRAEAWARSMRGRRDLIADGTGDDDLDRATAIARELGWRSFVPWPQTLRAELRRRRGDAAAARDELEHALETSRQLADPCWEAMALRGLGMLLVDDGRVADGLAMLEEAPRRCRRLPDTYRWVEAFGLDALADVATELGLDTAASWIDQLDRLAGGHSMADLQRNVATYRTRTDA